MTTITLLHPGAMGAPVGAEAVAAGHTVLWVDAARSAASRLRADTHGLTPCSRLDSALLRSEMVLSICPPAAAESVSAAVADAGFTGIYVDANAISPGRMERISAVQHRTGAQCVDGAIIGAPPSPSSRPRLYLAGDQADIVAAVFGGTAVHPERLDLPLGAASALKMAFGGFQKASAALAAVSHALAREFGVNEELVAEGLLTQRNGLANTGHLPTLAAKAWRWGPEMREVAHTLDAVGLPSEFALTAAEIMRHWESDKDHVDVQLATVLDRLRR